MYLRFRNQPVQETGGEDRVTARPEQDRPLGRAVGMLLRGLRASAWRLGGRCLAFLRSREFFLVLATNLQLAALRVFDGRYSLSLEFNVL